MDEETGEVDRLRNLPESLLFQILLKIPTKDVVKTIVLSSSWRNLWKFVPGLDLKYRRDFTDCNAFVSFMDEFLSFNNVLCIENFKLKFENGKPEDVHITRWMNKVIERKVQHLDVSDKFWFKDILRIPTTIYTCKSLVSLKLYATILPNPEFVSLPSIKVLVLDAVVFANDLAFEMLISGCSVLESLTVCNSSCVDVLRVGSQSLLSFTYCIYLSDEEVVVAIDAPRLEYLILNDDEAVVSFIIESHGSLVKVDIDTGFGGEGINLSKRNMIRNFLIGISGVKVLNISSITLEVISIYLRGEPLPLFSNLSFLHVDFNDYNWEVLPIFLDNSPNLKSLSLGFSKLRGVKRVGTVPEPRQLLTSLEYVKIVKPMLEEATHMKLVSYFLKNSTILKNFTFFLDDFKKSEEFVILKKLLAIPRLSSSCEFSLFEYARTSRN